MPERHVVRADRNDSDGTVEYDPEIPNLDAWIDRFVDERQIYSGAKVFVAEVEDGETMHLSVNPRFATAEAERVHEEDDVDPAALV